MSVEFEVRGLPVAQGSKKAFRLPNGRISMVDVKGDKLTQWRHAINDEARKAMTESPYEGPILVRADFRLLKPASAPKKKRVWPIGKMSGDLDKLARALLDAMTGVVFNDDSQVTKLQVTKDYGDPGCTIYVAQLVDGGEYVIEEVS